ncbi:hypothetical protein CSOJ01_09027 [Colletotrichum sojae]|uniref:Uncharacterized protein n=1 Tax=Colletotrichum sojae TaxID=2175907 RepID=A0A8H6J4S9_9PEZI|nr:hypothetical protein CSOJ01_09027 [Colletotrichum sojae]
MCYGEVRCHWTPEGDQISPREVRVPIESLEGLSAAQVIELVRHHRKSLVSLELDMYRGMIQNMRRTEREWIGTDRGCVAAMIGETMMRLDKQGLDLIAPGADVASRFEGSHKDLVRVLAWPRYAGPLKPYGTATDALFVWPPS